MIILLHRAGVTIGDGCVIGAGSVVTKSMPAYHVVVGNPTRAYQKVAPDVPDAPGLIYEVEGDGVFVVGKKSSVGRSFEGGLGSLHQKNREFGPQSLGWAGFCEAQARVLPVEVFPAAIHVCALVAAAALGYWLNSLT